MILRGSNDKILLFKLMHVESDHPHPKILCQFSCFCCLKKTDHNFLLPIQQICYCVCVKKTFLQLFVDSFTRHVYANKNIFVLRDMLKLSKHRIYVLICRIIQRFKKPKT